jgi:hypothetical protein
LPFKLEPGHWSLEISLGERPFFRTTDPFAGTGCVGHAQGFEGEHTPLREHTRLDVTIVVERER